MEYDPNGMETFLRNQYKSWPPGKIDATAPVPSRSAIQVSCLDPSAHDSPRIEFADVGHYSPEEVDQLGLGNSFSYHRNRCEHLDQSIVSGVVVDREIGEYTCALSNHRFDGWNTLGIISLRREIAIESLSCRRYV
jgi:hypothetical protein